MNPKNEEDERYMRRCLQLAANGLCRTAPNPMVGAVLVCDGRSIGEGYHVRCGQAHAEVNAIRSVKDPALLTRATLYVSLEPCAHYGKTPPCADLIVEKGIPRIVVGCQDPFARVAGRGIQKLRDAGREVVTGVLEDECRALIRRFLTFHNCHRPYITLKWAESADGYLDLNRTAGAPVRLSNDLTAMLVHKKRAEHSAILVGTRTALLDNPSLTVRHWYGPSPVRVVIDRRGVLPATLRLFDGQAPTLRNLQSLLVEGGGATLRTFIEAGLWDEAFVEESPVRLGDGVPAPTIDRKKICHIEQHFGRLIRHYWEKKNPF